LSKHHCQHNDLNVDHLLQTSIPRDNIIIRTVSNNKLDYMRSHLVRTTTKCQFWKWNTVYGCSKETQWRSTWSSFRVATKWSCHGYKTWGAICLLVGKLTNYKLENATPYVHQ
jgi:hypothetical protein